MMGTQHFDKNDIKCTFTNVNIKNNWIKATEYYTGISSSVPFGFNMPPFSSVRMGNRFVVKGE